MPRITKKLPAERSDYSFGDLVYWHLFRFGTRPTVNPSDKAGRVWDIDSICALLDITPRTLRNWIADKHLPDAVTPLSSELFGDNPAWDEARLELQAKFEQGWAAKRGQGKAARPEPVTPPEVAAGPEEILEPAGASDDADETARRGERRGARAIIIQVPEKLRMHQQAGRRPVRAWTSAVVAVLAITAGAIAWLQAPRKLPSSPVQPKQTVTEVAPPKPLPKQPETTPQKPVPKAPIKEAGVKEPVRPLPKPEPSAEEQRLAKERSLTEKLIAARQAAHDADMRRRDDEARRLDGERQAAADQQRQLEDDARTAAGLGYRLRENTSVAGSSSSHLLTANIADCALACLRDNCDGFSWYRDQYPRTSRRVRTCYLFRKPFVTANYPGYAFGEPVADANLSRTSSSLAEGRPVQLAQATTKTPDSKASDDLVRCAGGPVKVTGFTLTCDRILGGGTTLGSARLSYTVANINECANKCRAVQRCVAFTFNSGDPEGQHACMIFGPTPEGRESKGWVSGVR